MIAVALPVMLLLACGGGGSGGTTATRMPTTDNGGGGQPTGPQALPTALISDVDGARNLVPGATAPPTTLTSAQIQQTFRMRAMNANTLTVSDVYSTHITGVRDIPVTCSGRSCNDITFAGIILGISLDNIATDIGNRFELTRVNSNYSPVMVHRDITLSQYRAAGRDSDNAVFEYLSYGGWLTESAFSVDALSRGSPDRFYLLVGNSYGVGSNSRPTVSGAVEWQGVMVGVNKSSGDPFQGNTAIQGNFDNSPNINIIFSNIRNLRTGTQSVMVWGDVAVETDGTFSSTTGGDIDGSFYGTGHEEVGGTFNRDGIIGAFGARR